MKKILALCIAVAISMQGSANGDLISEFFGNQPGNDPADQSIELSGTANLAFDLWVVSIESDPGSSEGVVDRASNVTGTYDANGLAVVTVPDLENPSFTLVLASDFTGAIGDDLDSDDDGVVDSFASFTGIMDAVGVTEDVGDPNYADDFGGVYFVGDGGDPDLVFRAGSVGDWYFNTGTTTSDASATAVSGFSADPLTPTFGSINPVIAIPEPSSLALLGLIGCAGLTRRRR